MKPVTKYAFCLAVVVLCFSCARDYDIDKLNKTITFGGKYFMSPLLSTNQMSLDALLDSSDRRKISVKDGHYYYEMRDTINLEFSVKEIEEKMKTNSQKLKFAEMSETAEKEYKAGEEFSVNIGGSSSVSFEFNFAEAKEKGLVRLDAAGFKNAKLVVSGDWKADGAVRHGDVINVTFELPSGYVTEGGDNKVKMAMKCDNEGKFTGSQSITCFAFVSKEKMEYTHQLKIKSASATLASKLTNGTTCTLNLDAKIGSGDAGVDIMVPEVVYGLVDVTVKPHKKSLPIEDVPSIMKDAVLDLQNPVILIDYASNAGIPFESPVKLAYHRDESPLVAEKSAALSTTLYVDTTGSKGVMKATKYYLADDENGQLKDKGYGFQKFSLRGDSCFYVIPDELVLEAEPTMKLKRDDGEELQHVVWFDDYEYDVKGDVTISLPFLFGKDLLMTVVQTFSGVPELVGSTAQKNDISILGLFENNYPQNFVVQAELRDSLDRPIGDGLYSSPDTARCAMTEGEVVKDTIFLNFERCVDAIKASKIKLNIHLVGSEAEKRYIDSTDYLQLNLKLSTQDYGEDNGGITINLDDAK